MTLLDAGPSLLGRSGDAGELARTTLDAAILSRRAQTPRSTLEKRSEPRLSIAEINQADPEAIRERIEKMSRFDTRSPVTKFLDIVDLPRNTVANLITSVAMPSARRAAVMRGEFDDTGLPKVYGSDILRGLGIKNRAATGVGGFALDLVTDPISWAFAPMGGLASVGKTGAKLAVGSAGQKAVRRGLKAVSGGRAVHDDTVRAIFEATAKVEGIDLSTGKEAARRLSETLLGDRGLLGRVPGGVLGETSKGGNLADLAYKVADAGTDIARTADEAEQIRAVGRFVERYTLNPTGLRIGGERAGTAIAHVPLTDITVYAPAFTRRGRQAVFQRAAAAAQAGKVVKAAALVEAEGLASSVGSLADEAQRLYESRLFYENNPSHLDAGALAWIDNRLGEIASEVRETTGAVSSMRGNTTLLNSVADIEDIGDALATAEYHQLAQAELKRVAAMSEWVNETERVSRLTGSEIGTLRNYLRASDDALSRVPDFEAIADDAAPLTLRARELEKARAFHVSLLQERLRQHAHLSEESLDAAETVADSFHALIEASSEVAQLTKKPLGDLMTADSRLLRDAALYGLRESVETVGEMPLMSLARALGVFGTSAAAAAATKLHPISRSIARSFGIPNNVVNSVRASLATIARAGSVDAGNRIAVEVAKDAAAIARKYGVVGKEQELRELATAMLYVREAGPQGLWATAFPNVAQPARVLARIDDARRSGLLQNPELAAELRAMAERYGEIARGYGEAIADEGMLRWLIESEGGQLPLVAAEEAVRRIREQRATGMIAEAGGGPQTARIAARAGEAFQRPRSTHEFRYVHRAKNPETGETTESVKSFLLMDAEVFGSLRPEDIAQFSDDPIPGIGRSLRSIIAEKVQNVQDFLRQYAPDPDSPDWTSLSRIYGRALDPFELNARANAGEFAPLIGGDSIVGGRMFETDLAHIMATRVAGAERLRAKQRFIENVVEPYGIKIAGEEMALRSQQPGATARAANGVQFTSLGGGRFLLGDTPYRLLDHRRVGVDSLGLMDETANPRVLKTLFPEVIAEQIERFAEQLTPQRLGMVLNMANTVARWWKVSALGHPSWIVINAVGNAFLAAMAHGVDLPTYTRNLTRAAQLIARRETRREGLVALGPRAMAADDLLRVGADNGILQGGHYYETYERFVSGHGTRPLSPRAVAGSFGRRVSDRHKRALEAAAIAGNVAEDKLPHATRRWLAARAAGGELGDQTSRAIGAWFRLNGKVDDIFRLASMMTWIENGDDVATAVAKTKRAMLNFGDFTAFEDKWMRSLLPFYSWIRASMPNMLGKFFDDPRYFTVIPKLRQAIEEATAGEERVPFYARPRWIQEQIGVQIGSDPETRNAILIGTAVPQEQAVRTLIGGAGAVGHAIETLTGADAPFDGRALMDSMDFWFGQGAPVPKVIVDLSTGRESFTGRTIGPDISEGDITINEYLLGQVRQLRELGVGGVRSGPLQRSFDEGIGSGLARLTIGGRIQPGLREERTQFGLLRDMREREERIRRAIRIAEREGNESASLEARAMLFRMYESYLAAGIDESAVPAWARSQMDELLRGTNRDVAVAEPG